MWRRRRGRRRRLVVLSVILVLMALVCTDLVGYPALGSLEWRYPADTPLPDKADAVVVLASGVRVLNKSGTLYELGPTCMGRCAKAAEVYHHAGPCVVVVSGGKSRPNTPGPSIAQAMKDFLVRMNVDPDDILVEGTSRTTYENAVQSYELIKKRDLQRIVLVTDASHMLRSQWCFEALGCPVIPVGCNYQPAMVAWTPEVFMPSAISVSKVCKASHEWFGILWYWLKGRLS